jgi:hypothetical protein
VDVKTPIRLSLTLGSALVIAVAALTPVAAASAAPKAVTTAAESRALVENPAKAAVQQAVAPSECDENTLLNLYVNKLLVNMTAEQLNFLFDHVDTLLDVPTYDPLFFGTAGDPDYALTLHARQLTNTFRDVKAFWSDVKSDDIQLMAMHGDVLLDADRIAATLTAMVEFDVIGNMSAAQIAREARTVATFMRGQGDFFNNPLWTLNAYAFSGEGDPEPEIEALPDKLVFGDGFLVAYDDFGLGDVGPRVVMGHEFAHHIQFELGTFNSGPTDPAEATRRTELMADGMAAYFGVHKAGLALNRKRVIDALLTFYSVGDCSFDSAGHHGTPAQRERAAAWGADLAAAAVPSSFVLPAAQVADMFDSALPEIVAPTS